MAKKNVTENAFNKLFDQTSESAVGSQEAAGETSGPSGRKRGRKPSRNGTSADKKWTPIGFGHDLRDYLDYRCYRDGYTLTGFVCELVEKDMEKYIEENGKKWE